MDNNLRKNVNHKKQISNNSHFTISTIDKIDSKNKQSLNAIICLFTITTLCFLLKISSILYFAFPLGAFVVGVFLYYQSPSFYLSFTWWIWFMSPLISRIVHYQNGWSDKLPIITYSPYLVTMITSITLIRFLPKYNSCGLDSLPFIMASTSLIYSLFIGFIKNPSTINVLGDYLRWSTGIFLGFYLLVNWRHYPSLSQSTKLVFVWALLIMGIYGTVQYFIPLEWDRFWLSGAENLQDCCGSPEAWNIRVWSTLNMPFTFAYGILPCLMVSLSNRNNFSNVAFIAGTLAFMLSQVRGAWFSFLAAFIIFFTSLKSNIQLLLIKYISMISIFMYSLFISGIFSDVVTSRVESLSNSNDSSLHTRIEFYSNNFNEAVFEIIGRGMGGEYLIDADALTPIAILGWFGIIIYMSSILMILIKLFRFPNDRLDLFTQSGRAICIGLLVGIPFFNVFTLLPGTMFWAFAGFTLAANKYYRYQIRKEYT